MSVTCPSCRMASSDGAAYCDFCKEPFQKKPKPAAPAPAAAPAAADPLAGLPKEKVLELPAAQLLKGDLPQGPAAPSWLRPLAWTFLALMLASGALSLWALQQRYQERQQDSPPAPAPGRP